MAARLKSLGLWAFLALSVVGIGQLVVTALGVRPGAGPARALEVLHGVWAAGAFTLLQVELGERIFARWLEADLESALARWLLAFSAGFFATVAALLALAAIRPLDGFAVGLYLAVAVCLIAPRLASRREALRRALLPPLDRDLAGALALVAAGVLILAPYLVQALLPNADWDGASTHLPLAARLVEHGLHALPADLDHLAIPAGVHLVYAAFAAAGAGTGVIALNWIVSLLVCAAAGALAATWGRAAGLLAAAVCASTNLVLELGLDPRIDGFLALFSATATLGVLIWLPRGGPRGALLLAALALANALATKETGLVVVALLGVPVILAVARADVTERTVRLRTAALALLFVLVPASGWYAAKAVRFGDPVHPWLRGPSIVAADGRRLPPREAAAPVLALVGDTPEFERLLAQMRSRIDAETAPSTLLDPWSVLTRPEDHARKPGHFLSPLLLFFVALPLARRDARALALYWMGGALFLVAATRSPLVRYALPAVPLLAAGAGVVAGAVRALPWRIAWVAALVAVGASNLRFEWQKLPVLRPRAWLSGASSEATWLTEVGYNLTPVLPRAALRIDRLTERGELDPDGRILLVGESKSHRLALDAVPDISRNGGPWLARLVRAGGDLDAVHRGLWNEGVRYVLYNRGHYEWVMANVEAKGDLLALSLVTLEPFLRERGRRVFQEGGITLFEIAPPR